MLGIFKRDKKTASSRRQEFKPQPNISEPVISIVNAIKSNPRQWKLSVESFGGASERYTILDKKRGISFSLVRLHRHFASSDNTHWMTAEEVKFAINSLQEMYSKRAERLYQLQGIRRNRVIQRHRNWLTSLYKEGV